MALHFLKYMENALCVQTLHDTPHYMKDSAVKQKINTVLDKVRPYIQSHGGDVRLVGVEGGSATLAVEGSCVGCPLARLTYDKVLKTTILEEVPEITDLVLT